MANESLNNNVADDFLSFHRSLGNHVLTTCVGGTGWLVDDISVSAQKFPPKTVLRKTSKCTDRGSIVLERLDGANLNTAFRAKAFFFKAPLATDVLDLVQTSQVDHQVNFRDTVTMVTRTEGGGGVSPLPFGKVGVNFSGRRRKVKCSKVKVTCKGLREETVDFGTLANKLASLSLKDPENLGNEDSFLVMTNVLVADEFSWTQISSEEKSERYGGKLTMGLGTCLGYVSRETETPEEHVHNDRDVILAYKLAKVKVTDKEKGTIAREDVLKEGEFEGNYTLARGEVDRDGQYALCVTYRQDGQARLGRCNLVFRLLGTGGTEDITIREEELLSSGTYQSSFSRCSSGLFPLRGVRVWKARERHKTLMDWIRVKFSSSKDRSQLKLIKVTVTDVQRDVTQVCRCGETEVARGDWAWFGCDGQDSGEGYTVSVEYTPTTGPTTTTDITVQPDAPLAALMSTLARETHVPCARQAILHDGEELMDPDVCLKKLGIVEGTHLVLKKIERRQTTFTDATDSVNGGPPDETDAIFDMERTTLVTRVIQEIKDLIAPECAETEDKQKWQDVQAILTEQITVNPDGYPEIPSAALQDIVRVISETEAAEVTDLLEEADDDISLLDVFCELSERLSRDPVS
ncbi:uncharacterized protein LOC118431089 [Branchiostoma floridae]|uniref:Uncharacterized protein LOC118431089 n=1 Tax=Branchiostoma floridae TaxID=7739 RepID=A0A9J7MF56_BRAFL|nr:uncharacterized protein LOC118431089 [Branchiostoma floridae]